jgi:hypothetical protein
MKIQRRQLQSIFLTYFAVVMTLAVFPPAVEQWNRIDPHILGLPLSQFCILLFACLLSAGLVLWFILEGRIDEREAAERARSQSREL